MRLIAEGIEKAFGEKEVLKGVTFSFEQGKIYGLLGRNGAGKTTLFKAIYGDFRDFGGRILIDRGEGSSAYRPKESVSPKVSTSIDDAGKAQLLIETDSDSESEALPDTVRKVTRDDVGMIFAEPMIPDFLTGYEFIKFYLEAHDKPIDRIDEMFALMAFENGDEHRLIKGYSSGMKSKIQVMTLLISRPSVMLLDEPLTSLDVVAADEIKNMLLSFREDHVIIMSTHILQLAKDMCDEIVLLKDGVLEGLPNLDKESSEYEQTIVEALR